MLTPLVLSSALLLASCSSEPDPLAEVPAFPVDVARVEVVDTGENPRVLRYDDIVDLEAEGAPEEAATPHAVDIATGFEQSVVSTDALEEEAPEDLELEPTTFNLDVLTTAAPEAGEDELEASRRVDFTLTGSEAPTPREQEDLDTVKDFKMSWRGTDQGRVSTIKLLSPDESEDEARAAAESSLLRVLSSNVIFPTEEIGEGGSWTVESRVTGDATMLRTTTYTVTSLNDEAVELDISIEERPAQAELNFDEQAAPDLAGESLNVESSNTHSEGSITVEFDSAIPVDGEITNTTRVVYAGSDDDFRVVQDQGSLISY